MKIVSAWACVAKKYLFNSFLSFIFNLQTLCGTKTKINVLKTTESMFLL